MAAFHGVMKLPLPKQPEEKFEDDDEEVKNNPSPACQKADPLLLSYIVMIGFRLELDHTDPKTECRVVSPG